jgi:hypothetical protein
MATQNKIIEMIGAIKTLYSYYAKDTDVKLLVKTWAALLESYPDEVVEVAFFKCLQTCKVPPTPADVIEQINALAKVNEPSDEELWAIYHKALMNTLRLMSQFDYTYIDATGISQGEQARRKVSEIYDGLPDKIKIYLASKSELMRNAQNLNYEDAAWEKQRFMKSMPIVAKRQEYSNFLKIEQVNRFFLE